MRAQAGDSPEAAAFVRSFFSHVAYASTLGASSFLPTLSLDYASANLPGLSVALQPGPSVVLQPGPSVAPQSGPSVVLQSGASSVQPGAHASTSPNAALVLAVCNAAYAHATTRLSTPVIGVVRDRLRPIVRTEAQFLYVLHVVGPLLQRLNQEKQRSPIEVPILSICDILGFVN